MAEQTRALLKLHAPKATGRISSASSHNNPSSRVLQQLSSPHHQHEQRDHQLNTSDINLAATDDDFAEDGPPAKKRKISLRFKQTTLDQWHGQSDALKPPNAVTAVAPHGQLVETVNGVTTAFDVNVDDVADQAAAAATPARQHTPAKPAATTAADKKKEEKRSLRSQDNGPKLKSDLATYFPDYEEIVFGDPEEPDFINIDTSLYIIDDAPRQQQSVSPPKGKAAASRRSNGSMNIPPATPRRTNSSQYNGCSPIDLGILARNIPAYTSDPLDDAYYLKSHRRAERREKQLRNIEKERAMHEKVQLERLLEGLLGHDWLKVLGITGITDGEAKKYEPKRKYFIAEVQGLVDKFKQWKDKEKQQRLAKEAAREAEESEEGSEDEDEGEEPPSSEQNASASRQLQRETNDTVQQRSGFKIKLSKGRAASHPSTPTPGVMAPPPLPAPAYVPYVPPEPIKSFYAKRHLRDAALKKARHAGRNVTAFGLPLPEMPEEREFELPEEFVSEEALRTRARERRRRKRESLVDGEGG
ncbi:hypothetical protein LTR62_006536 [Meristemomyces frigidus]|uniref:Something about silencing protein 4 domain-containing protein n=1 Tax=Meristemomyces frigidus TaxID=1508187 RepID=A0AAN7TBY0_9PEZI|nr:hypothetical protein LTR62_006536 [Meristemomyces frigidus]